MRRVEAYTLLRELGRRGPGAVCAAARLRQPDLVGVHEAGERRGTGGAGVLLGGLRSGVPATDGPGQLRSGEAAEAR